MACRLVVYYILYCPNTNMIIIWAVIFPAADGSVTQGFGWGSGRSRFGLLFREGWVILFRFKASVTLVARGG